MALFDRRDGFDAMADLLARERAAILAGRFDVLERLVADKERITRRLPRTGFGGDELAELRAMAIRNDALLKAARAGLDRVRSRIAALGKPVRALHTYDASGCRTALGDTRRGTDRLR